MKIWIVHNSKHGNGKIVAKKIAETFENAEINIGHIKEISPKRVVEDNPDLLIVGAAVRVFRIWGASRKWVKRLKQELKKANRTIPYGACFITHAMSKERTEQKAKSYLEMLKEGDYIEHVFPEWLSGQVKEIEGPLKEGVLERIEESSFDMVNWIYENQNSASSGFGNNLTMALYEHISILALF